MNIFVSLHNAMSKNYAFIVYRCIQKISCDYNGGDSTVYGLGVHENRNVMCDVFIELILFVRCVVSMSYIVNCVAIL